MIKLASKFCKAYYRARMRPKAKRSSRNDADGIRLSLGGPLHTLIYNHVEKLRRGIEAPRRPGIATVGSMYILEGTDSTLARIVDLERYMRRTFVRRQGHPPEDKVAVLNAYDEWLLDPGTSWRLLAAKYGFPSRKHLERAVLRLKRILKREEIPLPHRAQNIPPHN
jgi:hypothetical protein